MADGPAATQSDQGEVLAFLASPAAWPDGAGPVDIIDTHGSRIFLAGREALKVKRAVKLPYLDFSTLEARLHFCQREIELNQRHAPEIYQDVVAITRDADGRFHVGGEGTAVEWAVRMHRFAQDQLLSHIVEHSGCERALAESLGDLAARLHADAKPREGSGDLFDKSCDGVIAGLRAHITPRLAGELRNFEAGIAKQLALSADVRNFRAVSGFVRRCHGDLHLGNIVMWDGHPVPFDALEFDENLATTDTLYDLAFLLMDLWRFGAHAGANQVLNHYLWRTGDIIDIRGLRALPLFLGLRAGVRAMVALDLARVAGCHHDELAARSRETLELAVRLLNPEPPQLIAIGGLSGTGKSTVAAALAPQIGAVPGAIHLRSDMERKRLAGVEHFERLRASAYRPAVNSLVYARVLARARAALKAGHSVIIDSVSAKPEERLEIEALARETGVPFTGLWLEAEGRQLKERVDKRRDDASDATVAIVEQQLHYDIGEMTWTRIDASGPTDDGIMRARAALHLSPPPCGEG